MERDKKLFLLSVGVYLLNILFFLLSLFIFEMKKWAFLIFLGVLGYTIAIEIKMTLEMKQNLLIHNPEPNAPIKYSGWRKTLQNATCLAVFLLFFISVAILWEGSGTIVDGLYWLELKGDLIRPITEAEYRHFIFTETRMMIGFLLAFTVNPVAHYGEKLYA